MPARADEAVHTLVVSGDWVAKEQQDPAAAMQNVCIAFTAAADNGFGLRATADDFELRYSDNSWVLPANVSGNLVIDIGRYHSVFAVTGNTRNTAIATITPARLHILIAAMERAGSMTVTAGVAAPQRISLRGSNRATTAFLSCAASVGATGQDDWIRLSQ